MDKMILLNVTLATKIGVKNAIIFSDLMQSTETVGESHDGRKWLKESQKDLKSDFPFLSVQTSKRCLRDLSRRGLIKIGNYNESKFDRTNWYAIDYDAYYNIVG